MKKAPGSVADIQIGVVVVSSQTLLWMPLQIQNRVLYDIFRIWQIIVWFGFF